MSVGGIVQSTSFGSKWRGASMASCRTRTTKMSGVSTGDPVAGVTMAQQPRMKETGGLTQARVVRQGLKAVSQG